MEIKLLPDDAAVLGLLAERAKAAGLDHIWAEVDEKGRLTPVNYYTMRKRLHAGAARAKVAPGRIIHSLRHHAATAIIGDSGDLTLVKRQLGHSQITTSQRYAHAKDEKLLAVLERVSRNRPELPEGLGAEPQRTQGFEVVPPPRLERGTLGSTNRCSNQLS